MPRRSRRHTTATCNLAETDQARSLDHLLIESKMVFKRDVSGADGALSSEDMPGFMNLNYTANSSAFKA